MSGLERLRALAAYTAAGAAAGVAGPVLAGAVLAVAPDAAAWRLVLLLPVPFAAVTIVLALRALPKDGRATARTDLDLVGIGALGTITAVYVLSSLGIPAIVIALAMAPAAGARILAARWGAVLYARHGTAAIRAGLIAQTLCLVAAWIATLLLSDPWTLFVVLAALQIPSNIASGVVEPALRVVTLGFAPPGLHGVAASFLQLTQRLSATFFVALATGLLLTADGASSASFGWAVLVCVLASGLAAAVSFSGALRSPAAVLPPVSAVDPARGATAGD